MWHRRVCSGSGGDPGGTSQRRATYRRNVQGGNAHDYVGRWRVLSPLSHRPGPDRFLGYTLAVDLDALRLFVDLAETRSFSKTAGKHFVSQSAVSQRVRSLENELGHRLVERGKGRPGAHFTEAGERTLTYAREILARSDAMRRELADLGNEIGGALNVATVYSIGLHALTPAVTTFLRQYPQVNLHLEYLRTDRVYEALLSGSIDCGIVACPRERPGIDIKPLAAESMVVALRADHPLAQQETISPAALQGLAFVAFAPGHSHA